MKFSTFHSFTLTGGRVRDPDLKSVVVEMTHHEAIRAEMERILMAEELGFDGVWLREHHFTDYGFLPNTMVMSAHIAAATKRLRLGTAVVTLPLHHPIRAAEDAALVDVLSNGRLDYGIGRGYQSIEFQALGVPMDEARERCDEAIEVIRRLWTEPAVTHHGQFFHLDQVHLQPKPLQRPHPPMVYASISRESVLHYAVQGIPFMTDSSVTLTGLAELASAWHEVAQAHGQSTERAELVALRKVWLAPTNREAKAYVDAAPSVKTTAYDPKLAPVNPDGSVAKGYEYWKSGWHGRTLSYYDHKDDWEDRWIAGDLDRVIEGIKRLERIGYKNMVVSFGSDRTLVSKEETRRLMEVFAREVMPHCR